MNLNVSKYMQKSGLLVAHVLATRVDQSCVLTQIKERKKEQDKKSVVWISMIEYQLL